MKYSILMFLLVTFCVSCSKDPQISKKQSDEFVKFFGSAGMDSSAQVLSIDGGYLMLASERAGSEFRACIYKTDKNGNQLSRTVLCDTLSLVASAFVAANDGGYWVCGTTPVLEDSATQTYSDNVFLAKVSSEFTTTSISCIPAVNPDVKSVATDEDGAVYMACTSKSISGMSNILCIKADEQGEIWGKYFGGVGLNIGSGIAFYSGSIYIIGNSNDFKEFGQEKQNIVILNLNKDGQILDRMTYGGTGNDYGYSLTTYGGKLYASGSVFSDNDYSDGWLACFSGDLHNPEWTSTTHTRGYDELRSLSVGETGIVASGYTTDESLRTKNIYITRFSLDGTLLNEFVTGGNDNEIARSVTMAPDGQPVVTGTVYADADAVLFMLKTKL